MSSRLTQHAGVFVCCMGLVILVCTDRVSADEVLIPVVTLHAELRVPSGNTFQYVAATRIEQGQEIDYTVRIANPGESPLPAATVVQALPANTRYVAGSATGAGAEIRFSVDGGRSFGEPRTLKSPANASKIAVASEYTHIRWQLRYPLAPKAVVLARFRAVFE